MIKRKDFVNSVRVILTAPDLTYERYLDAMQLLSTKEERLFLETFEEQLDNGDGDEFLMKFAHDTFYPEVDETLTSYIS